MKILYNRTFGVSLVFAPHETKAALVFLRVMYKLINADFIREGIEEIEKDLRPVLTYNNRYHICEVCCKEIDTAKDHHINDNGWKHQKCATMRYKK